MSQVSCTMYKKAPLQITLILCCHAVYGPLNIQEIDRYWMINKLNNLDIGRLARGGRDIIIMVRDELKEKRIK